MARQIIDTDTQNPGWIGDIAKIAFTKTNENFKEIYDELGDGGSISARIQGKNLLINGSISVFQRGNAGNVTNTETFTVDRWSFASLGSASSNWGVGSFNEPLPAENAPRNYLGANVVAGVTSSWIRQKIENVFVGSGGKVTLSFWMRANAAGKKVGVRLIQDFGAGGSSPITVYGDVFTLDTVFKRYTCTFDLPSVAGKTIGQNDNLQVVFDFAAATGHGNQLVGQTGLFETTMIQLERGATVTSFEYRSRASELVLCRRYCRYGFVSSRQASGPVSNTGAGLFVAHEMRTTPAVTFSNTTYAYGCSGIGASATTRYGVEIFVTVTGSYAFSTNYLFDAEL
ncbi:hypothetical protein I5U30_00840 [Stenotrophomonas maltophilia]|nr:hypothetical protein [Stenotrophomonas maltophilia]